VARPRIKKGDISAPGTGKPPAQQACVGEKRVLVPGKAPGRGEKPVGIGSENGGKWFLTGKAGGPVSWVEGSREGEGEPEN